MVRWVPVSRSMLASVPGPYGVVRRIFVIASVAMIVAMLLHVFSHMALAGWRIGRTDEARDGAVLAWPIVDVPAWPMLAATAFGIGLLAAMIVLADQRSAQLDVPVLAALGFTAFVLAPLAFATWFGDASGLPITWNDDARRAGTTIGWHAALTPIMAGLVVATFVRSSRITRAARRRVASGSEAS